jgi:hypothetical protein
MSNLQKQLYGIAIFEEEIVLADFTGDGERRFVVSPEQLMAFVSAEVTFRPFPGLIWMKSDAQYETYLLMLPPGPRTILYRKGGKLVDYSLALPAMAIEARIAQSARTVNSIRMWGLAGKGLEAESILYELPLPNLSGAGLCLGSTERVVGNDVRAAVEKTIFDTPFNHHNHIVGLEKIPFHAYVKKHKGRCPFRTLKGLGKGRDILE